MFLYPPEVERMEVDVVTTADVYFYGVMVNVWEWMTEKFRQFVQYFHSRYVKVAEQAGSGRDGTEDLVDEKCFTIDFEEEL